jgi:hypothetical protein
VRNWQRPATTASIEGPGEATAGDAIRLVAQTDGTLSTCTVTHAWKVDDGPAGSDATLSPTLSAGEHTVTLTATSACGTTATATKTIKIAARPADAPKAAPAVVTLGGLAQGAQTRNGQPSLSGRAGTAPGDAPTVTVRIFEVSARVRAVAAQASSFAPGRLVEVQQVPVVNGTWTAKPVTALLPGRYQAIAEQGNVSGAVTRSVPIAFSVLGRCQSRRAFDLHLLRVKGGYGRLTVELNGRPLKVRGERRPVVHVDLKGMPKGKQVVRISAKTAGGRMLKSVRTFRTCAGALA